MVEKGFSNVANVYKAIAKNTFSFVTGKKPEYGFTANTSSKTLNSVITSTASHPFIAAGIVAGGITAAKSVPSLISSASKISVPNAISATGKVIGGTAIAAGAGFLAGGLLSGGGKATSSPTQNTTQDIVPNQNNQSTQNTNSYIDNSQKSSVKNYLRGDYGSIGGNLTPTLSSTTGISPSLSNSPSQNAIATANPEQTSTASSGISWQLIALIGAGIYFLNKN